MDGGKQRWMEGNSDGWREAAMDGGSSDGWRETAMDVMKTAMDVMKQRWMEGSSDGWMKTEDEVQNRRMKRRIAG